MSRPGDWYCRYCQNLNFQRRDACHRCGEPRQGGGDYGMMMSSFGGRGSILSGSSSFGFSTGPDVRPGDWYCNVSNCGAHNFASRSSCFNCGASKDELSSLGGGGGGGGSSSGGSCGGFDFHDHMPRMRGFTFGSGSVGSSRSAWKSGDWICSRLNCNEHNFASRMECFRCNAPKDSSY